MDIKKLTIDQNKLMVDALASINETGQNVVFVVNENLQLKGVLTDGDIRRAILNKASLETPVWELMNKNFVSLSVNTQNLEILQALNNKIKIIPLVDGQNKLVDYASISKLRRIPVASPVLTGNEMQYVADCINTNWISSQGKYVREFERVFSQYHNNFPALAVSNGTVALHLAIVALGIQPGDEILVPNLTFAASVNAIIYAGAVPVLVDIEPDSWNIDVEKAAMQVTSKTRAIMPVHLYGYPCDMDAVLSLAKKHDLLIIEDCAEALGSYYKSQPVGIFGDAATFSFFGNKTITTGEGGMVLFKDASTAEKAAMLRDHGMSKSKRYWHDEIGYNYRLTNIQAAIGVAQFERLNEFVLAKQRIAEKYSSVLNESSFFQTPHQSPAIVNSHWLYTFLVKETAPFTREQLMDYLASQGVETRPVFYPINEMPPYKKYQVSDDISVSERVSRMGMSLPSSVNLSEVEVVHICECIRSFFRNHQG